MRLTKKIAKGIPHYEPVNPSDKTLGGWNIGVTNKLGELENIEEELGIELETLFYALKNGIYVKPNEFEPNGFIEPKNIHLTKAFRIKNTNKWSWALWIKPHTPACTGYPLNEYGDTWKLSPFTEDIPDDDEHSMIYTAMFND